MPFVIRYLIREGVPKSIWEPLINLCTARERAMLLRDERDLVPKHQIKLAKDHRRKQIENAWNASAANRYVN